MDGLVAICRNCNQFTEIKQHGYVDLDGDFVNQGTVSLCCFDEVSLISEDIIEDWECEDLDGISPQELTDRDYLIYQAIMNQREDS